jgi:hypothetical protein
VRLVFRIGLFACALAVALLALIPLSETPLTSYDKINHILAFAVLAWLADGAYPGPESAPRRIGLLLLYGLLIEAVQHQLPYRQFSWLDLGADALGVAGYTGVAMLAAKASRTADPR